MSDPPNPYVGPRAFQYGETLYGRDREAQALLDLLIAERLVMLYSPSGAGKSSLLQAGLIPELEREGFYVWPVVRVGLQRSDSGAPPANRYLFSALLSLEEGLPAEQQRPVEELIGGDLAGYLQRRGADLGDKADNQVLIFDQFEEILTLDPTDRATKTAFFQQLGAVLRDRRYWALFALREDYIAGLDPYLPLLPTRLKATFRLDLLGEAAARDAIQRPARQAGIDFTDAAAGKLVDDLREIRLQQADGTIIAQPGPWIEPVQLQVVCRRLWDRLPADAITIEAEAVADVGTVNEALAGYYAEQVQTVAAATGVSERRIRDWCERQLITAQGVRGQVLHDAGRSQGLDNRAIAGLVDAHLVRTEQRRGAAWCELAHDRLIGPVKQNNAAWRETHLSTLQRQAALWEQQNHPDALALRDAALAEAEAWTAAHPEDLADHERAFLARCRELQELAERERRYYRRLRRLSILLAALSLLATGAAVFAFRSYLDANNQTAIAKAISAENLLHTQPMDGLVLAIEAAGWGRSPLNSEPPAAVVESLRHALQKTQERNVLPNNEGAVYAVALSADGRMLATSEGDTVRLWDTAGGQARGASLRGPANWIQALDFSPDGQWLAGGDQDGRVWLWEAATGRLLRELDGPGTVRQVLFSPDGQWLAGGGDNGVRLWEVTTGRRLWESIEPAAPLKTLAFSPDGKRLAGGDDHGNVRVWEAATGRLKGKQPPGHAASIQAVAFSSSGETLAMVGEDGRVHLWDLSEGQRRGEPWRIPGAEVMAAAFSADGEMLATGAEDGAIQLWEPATGMPLGKPFRGHSGNPRSGGVFGLAFSASGDVLTSFNGYDGVRLWDITAVQPPGRWLPTNGDKISAVAFSPSGAILASGDHAGHLRLWEVDSSNQWRQRPSSQGQGFITDIAFSPDGRMLAFADETGVRLWDVVGKQPLEAVPGGRAERAEKSFLPYGRRLAVAGNDGIWWLLDTTTTPLAQQELRPPPDLELEALSPDGRLAAGSNLHQDMVLWEVSSGRVVQQFEGHARPLWEIVFSPDGRLLASCGRDNRVQLSDTGTGQQQLLLESEDDVPSTLAFSPDGQILAVSAEKNVYFWDMKTHKRLGMIDMPGCRAVFSLDGRWLACGLNNGVRVWPLEKLKSWLDRQYEQSDWRTLLQQACQRLHGHSRWALGKTDTEANARKTCETFFPEADPRGTRGISTLTGAHR